MEMRAFMNLFFLCLCAVFFSLDLEEMENLSPFRRRCIIPVLGLIENSLYENSLVHNILCMLLQLLNACPKLADILLDHGLLYVLFNTLSTLNGMENGYGCQNRDDSFRLGLGRLWNKSLILSLLIDPLEKER